MSDVSKQSVSRNKMTWFWIAFALVVISGYQLGKDFALKENAKDKVHAGR